MISIPAHKSLTVSKVILQVNPPAYLNKLYIMITMTSYRYIRSCCCTELLRQGSVRESGRPRSIDREKDNRSSDEKSTRDSGASAD